MPRHHLILAACLLASAAISRPAAAYIDLAPTIAKVINDAKTIAVVELADFDRQKRIVTLKERLVLKGKPGDSPLLHQVADNDTAIIPRPILQWAEPGARAIVFSSTRTAIVCLGQSWYQLKLTGNQAGGWKLGLDRPELALTYYGSVSRLTQGVQKILAGGEAVLTMMPHSVTENAGFELSLNHLAYPGLVKLERVRASLKMPGTVWSVANNPMYVVGLGPVDEADLPQLEKQLESADPDSRAAAADDIRQLTEVVGAARTAAMTSPLQERLADPVPRVRTLAAATILRITHGHDAALKVLADALASQDPATRRDAATAAAVTGRAGAPLVPALAAMLQDADDATRFAALQALGTLGPIAAAARNAVVPLLDSPDDMIDAADALGRMGPRAQPVPPALAKMLTSDQPAVRLAALRGMCQIGGNEALPAAEYIAREIGSMSEIDGYNMVQMLALLGPIASAPASRIKTVPIPNSIVTDATNWAINAPTGFPWVGGTSNAFGPLGELVYASYVTALGERLKPCALALAPQLIAGKVGGPGDVPDWGYKILNAAPEESLATIVPQLTSHDKTLRERAAVILGHMGPPAAAARKFLEAAIAAASDPREKNLLAWSLHEITRD